MELIIQQLLAPALVILATQGVKKASAIPVNQGQTARIRTVAGVLSFTSALLAAFASGELEGFLNPDMVNVGVNAVVTFLIAHVGYKNFVKKD